MESVKGTKTERNILTAFAGESQARNRYTYFSKQAKKEGFVQIADIFEETAPEEVLEVEDTVIAETDVDRFLAGLAEFDSGIMGLYESARRDGEVLRYVGRLGADGTL